MTGLKSTHKNSGFTIIEVVMVLAIAGLIFTVVFAGVPRLQASRRDNQRKRDMEFLAAQTIRFEANVGRNPTETEVLNAFAGIDSPFSEYIDSANLTRPGGGSYEHYGFTSVADWKTGDFRYYGTRWVCNDTKDYWERTNVAIDWFLIIKLERGWFCLDSAS